MNIEEFPDEIIIYILSFVHISDLLNMQINKYFKNIIRSYSFDHYIICENKEIIKFLSKNFNFNNYDIWDSEITNYKNFSNCKYFYPNSEIKDKHLKYVSSCNKIILDFTDVTSSRLKQLKCSDISLGYCKKINDLKLKDLKCNKINLKNTNITDKTLKHSNCKIVNIGYCPKLTNKCTKYLKSCKKLNISDTQITKFNHFTHLTKITLRFINIKDKDLEYFKNCHTIDLLGCNLLTHKCTKKLKHCIKLNLSMTKINDMSLKKLDNCKHLNISHCIITGSGLKYLNCNYIDLSRTNLLRENIKYLTKCNELKLSNVGLKNKDLQYLQNCHTLRLYNSKITNKGLKYLSNIKKLYIENINITYGLKYLIACKEITIVNSNVRIKDLKHLNCDIIKIVYCDNVTLRDLSLLKCATISYYSDDFNDQSRYIKYNGIKAYKTQYYQF